MLLKGKTSIITGCNKGIGKKILEIFALNGSNIIACIRTKNTDFENFIERIKKKYNIDIIIIFFDLDDHFQIKDAIKNIIKLKLPIDILVNNAGISSGSLFQLTSRNEMVKVMNINFISQIIFTQGISRLMMRKKNGSIINISSISGIIGDSGTLTYGSSKASFNFATKTIASELGIYNVRVNAIAPGLVKTDMLNEMDKKLIKKIVDSSALKRICQPSEIASVVLFLASDLSSFITGQIIRVDGGVI